MILKIGGNADRGVAPRYIDYVGGEMTEYERLKNEAQKMRDEARGNVHCGELSTAAAIYELAAVQLITLPTLAEPLARLSTRVF